MIEIKLEDLTERQFGKLTVKKYIGNSKWLCECECGKLTEVLALNLKRGHTVSCGCARGTGIIGRKIGKLKVIEQLPGKKYLCECECGNIAVRQYKSLLNGDTSIISECDECAKKSRANTVRGKIFKDGTQPSKIELDKSPSKANKSGVVGVNWDKSRGKWQASLRFKGHKYNLGRFDKIEDAIEARKTAEIEIFGKYIENNK